MANSVKDFTSDKMRKMGASGSGPSKPKVDADATADDFGMSAAGVSNSSIKFKRGGAVQGEGAKPRLDRPGRKSGGMCETGTGERTARAKGGRVKGKTNINIIIGGDKGQQSAQPVPVPVPVPAGAGAPQMPPPRPPMPVMPMGGAPMGAGAPPMGGAPMPPQVPPQMMGRKRGGRVERADGGMVKEKFGARSGEGRLEKLKGVKKDGMAP